MTVLSMNPVDALVDAFEKVLAQGRPAKGELHSQSCVYRNSLNEHCVFGWRMIDADGFDSVPSAAWDHRGSIGTLVGKYPTIAERVRLDGLTILESSLLWSLAQAVHDGWMIPLGGGAETRRLVLLDRFREVVQTYKRSPLDYFVWHFVEDREPSWAHEPHEGILAIIDKVAKRLERN